METIHKPRRLLRAPELAEHLGMPQSTLYNRAKKDDWPHYRMGHAVRFDLEEVLAFLRERR